MTRISVLRARAMIKPRAAVSWSGGKDSYLALDRAAASFDIRALITMFTKDGTRSRSHGQRPEVLDHQARLLNLPLVHGRGSWKSYEQEFKRLLLELAGSGFSHVIFGDIFLDEHKAWVERVCDECGLQAVEPLWGEPTTELLRQSLGTGAHAQIVTTKATLPDDLWPGKQLREETLPTFESL